VYPPNDPRNESTTSVSVDGDTIEVSDPAICGQTSYTTTVLVTESEGVGWYDEVTVQS
jgi:hypothetical protein